MTYFISHFPPLFKFTRSLLPHFYFSVLQLILVCQSPHLKLLYCTGFNVMFLLVSFEKGAMNGFQKLKDMSHTTPTLCSWHVKLKALHLELFFFPNRLQRLIYYYSFYTLT